MTRRRRRAVAVAAGALLLVALVVLVVARGEAPADRAASFVPRDADLYVDVLTEPGTGQFDAARRAGERAPALDTLARRLALLGAPAADGTDLLRSARPWLGGEAAIALLAGEQQLAVLEVADREAAVRALAGLTGGAPLRAYGDERVRDGAFRSAALVDGFALVGSSHAVRRAIEAHRGNEAALADEGTFLRLRGDLPRDRVAHVWAAGPKAAPLAQGTPARLLRLAGVPPLRVAMGSLGFEDDRARLVLRGLAAPEPAAAPCPGPRAGRELELLERAPRGSVAYAGFAGVDCLVAALTGPPPTRVGDALTGFLRAARRGEAGVDVERELLPRLRGEAALFVTGGPVPALTLMVAGVDRRQTLELLGRLQPALIRRAAPGRLGAVPVFEARRVRGIEVLTVALAPGVELSYAVYDRKLVVSTSLKALLATRPGGGLADRPGFERVLEDRPERPTALVFLALDQLLALGDRLGPADDADFLTVREALTDLDAAGASFTREGEDTTAEVSLSLP